MPRLIYVKKNLGPVTIILKIHIGNRFIFQNCIYNQNLRTGVDTKNFGSK